MQRFIPINTYFRFCAGILIIMAFQNALAILQIIQPLSVVIPVTFPMIMYA